MKRSALIFAAVALVAAVAVPAASARSKVVKEIPTRAAISVTRSAADDGVTAKVTYTSSNPRCLGMKRFKRAGRENIYFQAYGSLLFGDPPGSLGRATLPGKGSLAPISPFGKSPLEWEAHFPGSTAVEVTNPASTSERHYLASVADATALEMYVGAPGSNGQGLPYFKVAYDQGDRRVILKCEQLKGAAFSGFAGTQFIVKVLPF